MLRPSLVALTLVLAAVTLSAAEGPFADLDPKAINIR